LRILLATTEFVNAEPLAILSTVIFNPSSLIMSALLAAHSDRNSSDSRDALTTIWKKKELEGIRREKKKKPLQK